jgi:hypothetical protein
MTMPGYTAEFALARSVGRYSGTKTAGGATGTIYPALLHGCYGTCLANQAGDPYAVENCRCICFGHPGRTCWLM